MIFQPQCKFNSSLVSLSKVNRNTIARVHIKVMLYENLRFSHGVTIFILYQYFLKKVISFWTHVEDTSAVKANHTHGNRHPLPTEACLSSVPNVCIKEELS